MSRNWEMLEKDCVNFLKDKYGDYFFHEGGSDSTKSDILFSKDDINFGIECKSSKAQSGQFVLFPNKRLRRFEFSVKNKTDAELPGAEEIISYMNENFDTFANPTTSGIDLNLPEEVMAKWIIGMYPQKGVKYVITRNKSGEYLIFPLEKLDEYFKIKVTYRVKKSGSQKLSKSGLSDLEWILQRQEINYKVHEDKSLESNELYDGQKVVSEERTYLLRKDRGNLFTVRMLSNTNNPNVIFSVELNEDQKQEMEDLIQFESEIVGNTK